MYFTKSQDVLNFFITLFLFERLASEFFRNIALAYTAGSFDKQGCFSACAKFI